MCIYANGHHISSLIEKGLDIADSFGLGHTTTVKQVFEDYGEEWLDEYESILRSAEDKRMARRRAVSL